MSHVRCKGPRVGKYHLNLKELDRIGAKAIKNALDCDLVVIDEVGTMELKSDSFIQAVEEAMESDRHILTVLHRSSDHPLAKRIRKEFQIITVEENNRDTLPEEIINRLGLS